MSVSLIQIVFRHVEDPSFAKRKFELTSMFAKYRPDTDNTVAHVVADDGRN